MSSRKPGYLIGVIMLAVVSSGQLIGMGVLAGISVVQNQSLTVLNNYVPSIPGVGATTYTPSAITHAAFWQDRFVYMGGFFEIGRFDWRVSEVSPESGDTNEVKVELSGTAWLMPMSIGERLWFVGGSKVFEYVNGELTSSQFVSPPNPAPCDGTLFALNGEPAFVESTPDGFVVLVIKHGAWQPIGMIVLPEYDGSKSSKDNPIGSYADGHIQCRNRGDQLHLFLNLGGRCYHREGIALKFEEDALEDEEVPMGDENHDSAEAVSALTATNTDGALAGWTLVCPITTSLKWNDPQLVSLDYLGLFVEGQPAALVFEEISPEVKICHVLRFDGDHWTAFASQPLPFGSSACRTVCNRDGQRSYIVAITSTGSTHIYAVEATGIRETHAAERLSNSVFPIASFYLSLPSFALLLGLLAGTGIWLLMWWFTKSEYGFATQTVMLASLGRRGLARLIDLGVIGLTTVGLGWSMTLGLDWATLLEALNLHTDHPTIDIAERAAAAIVVWLIAIVITMLIAQAAWGFTPGKWMCRLRTVRTSLRPCGFASSLAREVVFFVDCGNFFCWTPGIVSIALTNHRQRLGDLVADTIVIESHSLNPAPVRK